MIVQAATAITRATKSQAARSSERSQKLQVIRAQGRHLLRVPGLSKASLATSLYLLSRATKHGDTRNLQIRQDQIRAHLGYQNTVSIGNGCRELERKAGATFFRAFPTHYGELTFTHDECDVDSIPPKGTDWGKLSDILPPFDSIVQQVMRRQSNEGVRDALRILLWFLTEGVTWARTYVEVSDSQLGLKDGAGAKARRVLREAGFTVVEGSGRTPTSYQIGGGQPPEDRMPYQNMRTVYIDTQGEEPEEFQDAGCAGETFIHVDEMVDHVLAEYSVPPTPQIRELCSELINRGVDHKTFNQLTNEQDWKKPREASFGVGFVHERLNEMLRMTPTPLPPPVWETERDRATRKFFEIYQGSVQSMSEDELNDLRAWTVVHCAPPEVHSTILHFGLDDQRCLKWLTEGYIKRSGVDMTAWIDHLLELERSLGWQDG